MRFVVGMHMFLSNSMTAVQAMPCAMATTNRIVKNRGEEMSANRRCIRHFVVWLGFTYCVCFVANIAYIDEYGELVTQNS